MRFGLCTGPENLELVERLGFDYIECALAPLTAMDEGAFALFAERVQKSSLKVERFNVLFPAEIRLVGAGADPEKIGAYLERAFSRARALGGTLAVFGSGGSRAFPPGLSLREGFRDLIRVTRQIAGLAASCGLKIAIEPLNRGETNCINNLREGALLQAAADSPALTLLADLYHLLRENEPLENILAVRELGHTHIALRDSRAYPTAPDPDVEAFFQALGRISYTGTMSIEGRSDNLEQDAAAALKTLRSLC